MTEVTFEGSFFDGIICLFAIIHMPREEQPALFEMKATWLKPGGTLAVTVRHQAWTGIEEHWQDVPGARFSTARGLGPTVRGVMLLHRGNFDRQGMGLR